MYNCILPPSIQVRVEIYRSDGSNLVPARDFDRTEISYASCSVS